MRIHNYYIEYTYYTWKHGIIIMCYDENARMYHFSIHYHSIIVCYENFFLTWFTWKQAGSTTVSFRGSTTVSFRVSIMPAWPVRCHAESCGSACQLWYVALLALCTCAFMLLTCAFMSGNKTGNSDRWRRRFYFLENRSVFIHSVFIPIFNIITLKHVFVSY